MIFTDDWVFRPEELNLAAIAANAESVVPDDLDGLAFATAFAALVAAQVSVITMNNLCHALEHIEVAIEKVADGLNNIAQHTSE